MGKSDIISRQSVNYELHMLQAGNYRARCKGTVSAAVNSRSSATVPKRRLSGRTDRRLQLDPLSIDAPVENATCPGSDGMKRFSSTWPGASEGKANGNRGRRGTQGDSPLRCGEFAGASCPGTCKRRMVQGGAGYRYSGPFGYSEFS